MADGFSSSSGSLELCPPEQGRRTGETWTVHWKEHGGWRVLPLQKYFGFAASQEEILSKVESRINANPKWAANWLQSHGPGEFYAVEIQRYVVLYHLPEGFVDG